MRRTATTFSDTEKSYYAVMLENLFMTKYGQDFENFAGDVFRRVYGGAFLPVSSGGGDNKNDGIVPSERIMFQCYAPLKHDISKLNSKIKEDYLGAVENWPGRFDTWKLVFCHPNNEGLNYKTVELILDLMDTSGPTIEHMGKTELVRFALRISREEMLLWIGSAPIEVVELGYELQLWEIGHVCRAVASDAIALDDDSVIDEVPPTKLDYNRIPDEVKQYLQKGHVLAGRVEEFIRTAPEATLGDRVAKHFKEEYRLQRERHGADARAIYYGLFDAIRHRVDQLDPDKEELAAHAILAFLFNSCDIFERPPAGWQGHAS